MINCNDYPFSSMMLRPQIRLGAAMAFLSLATYAAQAQEGISASASDPIFELSPFEVRTTEDGGYTVTDTLAASRIRTDLKDVGASLNILTKEFMNDLGASDLMEVANFAPSVEAVKNQESGQDDNTGVYRAQQFRIRGLFTEALSRNYHTVSIGIMPPADGYNIDRITISSGANSILFGSANPAGIVNTSTLKPVMGAQSSKILYRTDNYGTQRFEIDHNQPLLDGRAAVRMALLKSDQELFFDPSWKNEERAFIAGKVEITKKTSIYGNFEYIDFERNQPSWAAYINNFGAWEDAGRPLVPYTGSNPAVPGIRNYTAGTWQNPIYGSAGQTDLVPSWQWHPISQFNRESVTNHNRISMSPEFAPRENFIGNLRVDDRYGWIGDVALEHKFSEDFHMQFALFGMRQRQDVWTTWTANQIYADAASTLPDGSSNPDAGRYFLNAGAMQLRDFEYEQFNWRWTASYDLDLRDKAGWMGRHYIALMVENREGTRYTDRAQLFNTDAARPNSNPISNANLLRPIIYIDPDNTVDAVGPAPDTRTMATDLSTFPGVTAEWKNFAEGTYTDVNQRSYLAAMQSHFLNGRFVTTFGYRIDEQDLYDIAPADWQKDADGFYVGYRDVTNRPTSVPESSGIEESTYSAGAVFHVLENKGIVDYLSLTYNQSTNFEPSPGAPNFQGKIRPNATGETQDYGIKMALWGEKLVATLSMFESGQKNARLSGIGFMKFQYEQIWDGLETITGDPSFQNFVLDNQVTNGDTFDLDAEGIEFRVDYNPVPNWRINIMASRNETVMSNIAPSARQYHDETKGPLSADYGNVILPGNLTVDEILFDIENKLSVVEAQTGTQPLNQHEWQVSMNTQYSFTGEALRGWTIGGSMRWHDEPVIGWARDDDGNPEIDKPFYGDSFLTVNFMISYRKKLFNDKVIWLTQLNIRNVFDKTDVVPLLAEESAEVEGKPLIYAYNWREPRSFILTMTFKF